MLHISKRYAKLIESLPGSPTGSRLDPRKGLGVSLVSPARTPFPRQWLLPEGSGCSRKSPYEISWASPEEEQGEEKLRGIFEIEKSYSYIYN